MTPRKVRSLPSKENVKSIYINASPSHCTAILFSLGYPPIGNQIHALPSAEDVIAGICVFDGLTSDLVCYSFSPVDFQCHLKVLSNQVGDVRTLPPRPPFPKKKKK